MLDFGETFCYIKNEVKNVKLETSIYPYDPPLAKLPFHLTGIGGSSFQKRVCRPGGYMWHQILFCADGEGVLICGEKSFDIAPKSFVFLPKNVAHEYYPKDKMWEVRWVCFDGGSCDETLEMLGFAQPMVIAGDNTAEAEKLFERMFESQRTDIVYSGYTCSGLLYEYVLALRRLVTTDEDKAKSRNLSTLFPALKYMSDNFAQDIPMSYLAKLIGVTPQHFCRLFKSTLNMRPNDFLTNRRLEEAARLLREGCTVAEAASRCGFHDPGYFSTVFRKHGGISPTAYKEQLSEKK